MNGSYRQSVYRQSVYYTHFGAGLQSSEVAVSADADMVWAKSAACVHTVYMMYNRRNTVSPSLGFPLTNVG